MTRSLVRALVIVAVGLALVAAAVGPLAARPPAARAVFHAHKSHAALMPLDTTEDVPVTAGFIEVDTRQSSNAPERGVRR